MAVGVLLLAYQLFSVSDPCCCCPVSCLCACCRPCGCDAVASSAVTTTAAWWLQTAPCSVPTYSPSPPALCCLVTVSSC